MAPMDHLVTEIIDGAYRRWTDHAPEPGDAQLIVLAALRDEIRQGTLRGTQRGSNGNHRLPDQVRALAPPFATGGGLVAIIYGVLERLLGG